MSYGQRLGAVAVLVLVAVSALAALGWWLTGPHVPKNAGRCRGPDPFVAHWRTLTPGFAFVGADGATHETRPMVVSTAARCVEAHCRDGAWDGEWTTFRRDGSVAQTGTYRHGLRVGTWTHLGPDGGTLGSVSFLDGNGHWRDWADDGHLTEEGDFVEGEQSGPWRTYFEDGGLASEVHYVHGLEDGEERSFDPDAGTWAASWYVYGRPADAGTRRPRYVPRLVPSGDVPGCGP